MSVAIAFFYYVTVKVDGFLLLDKHYVNDYSVLECDLLAFQKLAVKDWDRCFVAPRNYGVGLLKLSQWNSNHETSVGMKQNNKGLFPWFFPGKDFDDISYGASLCKSCKSHTRPIPLNRLSVDGFSIIMDGLRASCI